MTRRERGGCGAEDQHQRVPAMGRGTCSEKRRGRGDGMGAEDGDTWAETVRNGAVNRGGVARPSGRWGDGGQVGCLSFAGHPVLWRYEEVYLFEINGDSCWHGGGWHRGGKRGRASGDGQCCAP